MATETTKKATEAEKKTDAANAETSAAKKPAASSKTTAKNVKSTEPKTTEKKKNDDQKSEKSDTKTTSDKKSAENKVEKKCQTEKSNESKTAGKVEESDKLAQESKAVEKDIPEAEISKEIKSTETVEERTMFALELKRKVPMYTHMSMNAACRMIKGNVICKSDKPTNGWITIYAGIPEIGKVTGYIRIEQLGWR